MYSCTTPSALRNIVEPMREVRKLCANYVQTMRELVVPIRVNVDTNWQAFVYSSCHDKIDKSRASVKLA